MLDQAFHAAQTGRANEDFRSFCDGHRRLASTFDLEGEHSTEHRHLALGDFVSRMEIQSWIMHTFDLWMLDQKICDFHPVFRMGAHPPWQRTHSTQNQPAIERRGDRAPGILDAADALEKLTFLLCDDNSASHVTMATEIFC